jgi:type I restriction enzyme M protein
MHSDGRSLDDKRTELGNDGDIDDIVARYRSLTENPAQEAERTRKDQSFLVPVQEIIEKGYDLNINRYKESNYVGEQYDHPSVSITRFRELEEEILAGIDKLEAMFE